MGQQYTITVAYDGTEYAGWQVQPNALSVAQVLQDRFHDAFYDAIKLLGASRTDAGVHAHGQVAKFETNLALEPKKILSVWNQHLPQDILIRELEPSDKNFNPRYQVEQKIYYYHFFVEHPHPFYARYGYYFPHKVDLEKLRVCLALFIGVHDFRSFCTGEYESTIRSIDEITLIFDHQFNAYRIEVHGRSFLRYMIRRIIGACLKVASSDLKPEYLAQVLAEKNPNQLLPTAPSQGLILYSIRY